MLADRILAWSLAFALAIFPTLSLAQSATLPGFPPGAFQSRAALDAAAAGGCTAVAHDADGTLSANGGAGVTSITDNSLTVGAVTNPGITWVFEFKDALPTVTATWNGNAMTQVASNNPGAANPNTVIFAISGAGATTGNHTLSASWTGATQVYAQATSWAHVDQTNGTTSFPNGAGANNTTATASVNITSATNDKVVGVFGQAAGPGFTAVNGTTLFNSTALNQNAAANYNSGGATVTVQATSTSGNWSVAAVDIKCQ